MGEVQTITKHRSILPATSAQPNHKAWASVPFWVWLIFAAAAFFGLFSANAALISCGILILPLFVKLVWRRGEPPVLLFACFMQWVQVTAILFYANYLHISLS